MNTWMTKTPVTAVLAALAMQGQAAIAAPATSPLSRPASAVSLLPVHPSRENGLDLKTRFLGKAIELQMRATADRAVRLQLRLPSRWASFVSLVDKPSGIRTGVTFHLPRSGPIRTANVVLPHGGRWWLSSMFLPDSEDNFFKLYGTITVPNVIQPS